MASVAGSGTQLSGLTGVSKAGEDPAWPPRGPGHRQDGTETAVLPARLLTCGRRAQAAGLGRPAEARPDPALHPGGHFLAVTLAGHCAFLGLCFRSFRGDSHYRTAPASSGALCPRSPVVGVFGAWFLLLHVMCT